ncbi:PucR family transcriptional regulator [Nocardia goodfellowii]|uniref:DNA-binding PucR family transcriptional regulator n=1 Tax=Nocardia goodfellowii TaxID=882446 RepID=A0ABS4QJA4_9NOCA|nr:helix-turn-helix domain-containing protein [Nocardia goodfellowii]MBP2191794.1 DNA-binding PucR family transcriptional regulator [Nocardia goodfellowii]
MSARSHSDSALFPDEVQAERKRIIGNAYDHAEQIADAGMSAILAQIPGYAGRDETFHADVHDQLTRLSRSGLGAFLDHRKVTVNDIAYARQAAARRARAGITLVDYIAAFRLGQQATWKSLLSFAGESEAGRQAALSIVVPLARYNDLISTEAANAFLEFQRSCASDSGREGQELLESLLAGALPERGPQLARASAHGIGAESTAAMVVVTATVLGSQQRGEQYGTETEARQLAAAAMAGVGVNGLRTLAVVRGAEIIAVPALGRSASTAELCERLQAMQSKLSAAGITLAVGVSTVVSGVAALPKAYQQSRNALGLLPEAGGVLALPHLTPFRYLMLRADDTARHLIDPGIAAVLSEDRIRGGVLADTIRAFAAADMNIREAADKLRIHHNTAKYRLRRIQDLTGRSVRSIDDLVELLVAIELQPG